MKNTRHIKQPEEGAMNVIAAKRCGKLNIRPNTKATVALHKKLMIK